MSTTAAGPRGDSRPGTRQVTITVFGTPAPQGSKRAFIAGGRARVIESSHDRVKSWRQAVIDEVRSIKPHLAVALPFAGPVEIEMTFDLARPKSHYRTGRNAHLLRDSAPPYPSGTPDLSKLARATEDALTEVGLWADDALVVRYALLQKRWAETGTLPGADITVRELT